MRKVKRSTKEGDHVGPLQIVNCNSVYIPWRVLDFKQTGAMKQFMLMNFTLSTMKKENKNLIVAKREQRMFYYRGILSCNLKKV